ncbi:MAG: hypothetical protein A2355_12175 [Spirochaetes bacterium RIFOXYB1_FULL_32_8]|nr:MAG: hypothetical protein A2Y30_10255 [Spirochaetes bacterium GWE1_32_154]OHD79854.1 MAG: hypothetical protein A2355_12175 [Spirochaetes bacterium RIFOXYB1_FULL_32_8]HBD92709.1 hypothetical protein [Spirochaetia bacterium]HBI39023.1 hypothetical protein [Spirochaetia bacterium]
MSEERKIPIINDDIDFFSYGIRCDNEEIKKEDAQNYVKLDFNGFCGQLGTKVYLVNNHPKKSISVLIKIQFMYENRLCENYTTIKVYPTQKKEIGCTIPGPSISQKFIYSIVSAEYSKE